MEEWRPVVGFEGFYEVSDQGHVRSLDRITRHPKGGVCRLRGSIKKRTRASFGYWQVTLSRDGRQYARHVHVLVAAAFIGPVPEGMEVRHWDGDPQNCLLSNLRYGTRKDNQADAVRHGTKPKGEGHSLAKLTEDQVRLMRSLRPAIPYSKLAARFGVTKHAAQQICSRATWRHVD